MPYENRVGDNFPFETEFESFKQQVEGVLSFLDKYGVTLSDEEKISRLTPKTGHEKYGALVISLSRKNNISIPGVSLEGIERDYKLYKTLEPLLLLAPHWQKLKDTYRQAGHEYWQGFLAYYGALTNAGNWNPAVAEEVAPVVEFMTPKRAKKAEEEPKPEETKK